nr:hypothetical protein [Tanacetum cinerariifolium]
MQNESVLLLSIQTLNVCMTMLKTEKMVPTDMVPVLLVRHQVPNLFKTPLVGLEVYPVSLKEKPWEILEQPFRAVSFKVPLSSALIATVALLIIIVVVAVVVVGVVVIVAVVVIGVVVIVAVIVVGVVVVGICRLASTVPGQMANPFEIIAPRWARTFIMVITLGT